MRDQRSAPVARASASCRAVRSASKAARRASTSSGRVSAPSITLRFNHNPVGLCTRFAAQPAVCGCHVCCGLRQSMPYRM